MLPILYSFRRCPYAIRARLALHASLTDYTLREVVLRRKPDAMLAASPKGSVPVLVLPDGAVIDESFDIMQWALQRNDPDNWLGSDGQSLAATLALVQINDSSFKAALDRYKYTGRYPEHPQIYYRTQGEQFLQQLEICLEENVYLLSSHLSLADAAILPFVRQFAGVDQNWFDQSPYPKLRTWCRSFIDSALFTAVMKKYPAWRDGNEPNC